MTKVTKIEEIVNCEVVSKSYVLRVKVFEL